MTTCVCTSMLVVLLSPFLAAVASEDGCNVDGTSGMAGRRCSLDLRQDKGRLYVVRPGRRSHPFTDYSSWINVPDNLGSLEQFLKLWSSAKTLYECLESPTLRLQSRLLNITATSNNLNFISPFRTSEPHSADSGWSEESRIGISWACGGGGVRDGEKEEEEERGNAGDGEDKKMKACRTSILRADGRSLFLHHESSLYSLDLVFGQNSSLDYDLSIGVGDGGGGEEPKSVVPRMAVRRWSKTEKKNFDIILVEMKKAKEDQRENRWDEEILRMCNVDVEGHGSKEEGMEETLNEATSHLYKIITKDGTSDSRDWLVWLVWHHFTVNVKHRNCSVSQLAVPALDLILIGILKSERPGTHFRPLTGNPKSHRSTSRVFHAQEPPSVPHSQAPPSGSRPRAPFTMSVEALTSDLAGKLFGRYLLGFWQMANSSHFGENVDSNAVNIDDEYCDSEDDNFESDFEKTKRKRDKVGSNKHLYKKDRTQKRKCWPADKWRNSAEDTRDGVSPTLAGGDHSDEEAEEEDWDEGAAFGGAVTLRVIHNLTTEHYSIQSNMSIREIPDDRDLVWIKQIVEHSAWPALTFKLKQVFNKSEEDGWETMKMITPWLSVLVRGEWEVPISQWYQKTSYFLFGKDTGLPPVFLVLDFEDSTEYKVEFHFPSLARKFHLHLSMKQAGVFKLTVEDEDEFFPYPHTIARVLVAFEELELGVHWQDTRWDLLADIWRDVWGAFGKVWDALVSSRDAEGRHQMTLFLEEILGSKALPQIVSGWEQIISMSEAKDVLCLIKELWNLATGDMGMCDVEAAEAGAGYSKDDANCFTVIDFLDALQDLGMVDVHLERSFITFPIFKVVQTLGDFMKMIIRS